MLNFKMKHTYIDNEFYHNKSPEINYKYHTLQFYIMKT